MTEAMKHALQRGIQAEQDAYDFYRIAAQKVNNDALKETFQNLAKDELNHRDFLTRLLESDDPLSVTIKAQTHDYRIAEEVISETPNLWADMPFSDAMALAVKREEAAMQTYEKLAAEASDPRLKELFTNLRNMEQAHKTALETLYLNTAYAEVW
ncbi:MAG: ferritin-like domain-containing protein [Saccharofermentanales bacterium]